VCQAVEGDIGAVVQEREAAAAVLRSSEKAAAQCVEEARQLQRQRGAGLAALVASAGRARAWVAEHVSLVDRIAAGRSGGSPGAAGGMAEDGSGAGRGPGAVRASGRVRGAGIAYGDLPPAVRATCEQMDFQVMQLVATRCASLLRLGRALRASRGALQDTLAPPAEHVGYLSRKPGSADTGGCGQGTGACEPLDSGTGSSLECRQWQGVSRGVEVEERG